MKRTGWMTLRLKTPNALRRDKAKFLVPEGNGIARPPGEVGENLHIREIDFGTERARHPLGEAPQLGQYRDVGRFESVVSRSESVEGTAVLKKTVA